MVRNGNYSQNGQPGQKLSKWLQMVKNGQRFAKLALKGQQLQKWSKMVENYQDFVKNCQKLQIE